MPPLLETGKERTLQMPNEVDEHVLNTLCVDRHQLAQQPHKLQAQHTHVIGLNKSVASGVMCHAKGRGGHSGLQRKSSNKPERQTEKDAE